MKIISNDSYTAIDDITMTTSSHGKSAQLGMANMDRTTLSQLQNLAARNVTRQHCGAVVRQQLCKAFRHAY